MTDADYLAWAQHHAALFYLKDDVAATMFPAWRSQLKDFVLAELRAASDELILGPPIYPSDQLRRVVEKVFEMRRRGLAAVDFVNECQQCGFGLVPVPAFASLWDGQWHYPWYEAVVLCPCTLGRNCQRRQMLAADEWDSDKRKKISKPRVMMDLEVYEQHNPTWRQQVALRAEECRAKGEAKFIADCAAGVHAVKQVVGMIAQRAELPSWPETPALSATAPQQLQSQEVPMF